MDSKNKPKYSVGDLVYYEYGGIVYNGIIDSITSTFGDVTVYRIPCSRTGHLKLELLECEIYNTYLECAHGMEDRPPCEDNNELTYEKIVALREKWKKGEMEIIDDTPTYYRILNEMGDVIEAQEKEINELKAQLKKQDI